MKTAIITGGTRGIGREIVTALYNEGYRVYFTFSNPDTDLSEFSHLGDRVTGILCDAADEQGTARLFEKIENECQKIDLCVCNAGISRWGLFTDMSGDEWDEIFNVNTKGVFLTAKYAARNMLKYHDGSIVTVSSIWGQCGASCEAAYSASKAAVIGFTKAIALELAPSNITVNCVCPGVIDTSMNSRFSAEEIAEITKEIPLERIGTPNEVADAVLFLARAKYITGQVLGVNGGMEI